MIILFEYYCFQNADVLRIDASRWVSIISFSVEFVKESVSVLPIGSGCFGLAFP